jgi:inosose dehydratase
MRWSLVGLCGILLLSASASADEKPRTPVVAAQLYVWTQHYGKQKQRMEDHLDEVFAATKRAGYDAVQGWLNFHSTPEAAEKVAARLKQHGLTMPAAYAGGVMHTREGGQASIQMIVQQAKNGVPYGLKLVVHNPQPIKGDKTDEELAVQAENLNRLGAALGQLGVKLAIHSHDPEMRNGAREWYHMLRNTDPQKVGFCLDLHWVLRGKQDPYRLLEDAGKRVFDLHLRNSRDGVWSEDLGDGDIDHARVRRILEKIGYQGLYTVELAYEAKTQQSRSLEENLRRSRDYVRRLLGP